MRKLIVLLAAGAVLASGALLAPFLFAQGAKAPAVQKVATQQLAPREETPDEAEAEVELSPVEQEEQGSVSSSTESALVPTPMSTSGDIAIDLSIPQTLVITRPEKDITTTYSSYFITGTSNPKESLFLDGEEIQRISTNGTFGVLVTLESGSNTFSFKQGSKTQKITIKRVSPSTEAQPISKITQSTIYPAVSAGLEYGDLLPVSCVGPSGATIKASIAGSTVTLEPVSATAKAGVPVLFKGKLSFNDFEDDQTHNMGAVTYTMTYKGETQKFTSSGEVFQAGKGTRIAIRVSDYAGFVYPDIDDLSIFQEKLKKGAVANIASQDNTYYELSSGGFVPKSMVQVVEGNVNVTNKLSAVSFSAASKSESFTFIGSSPSAYSTSWKDGVLTLKLFYATGTPKIGQIGSSSMFSSYTVTEEENAVVYAFTGKASAFLWGYNVTFDGNNTVLTCNQKPTISGTGSQPLKGLTVMVDAGHGGRDGGALGVAGTTGPTENMVNLAHAYVLRDTLKSKGAQVVMTRTNDSFVSLDERLEKFEKSGADIFLSVHHNSMAETTDANKVSGMEVYYHTYFSKKLAASAMQAMEAGLGRNGRRVDQSYYRVTLMPQAPSVLLELGFMSNPVEYTRATNKNEMQKVADSLVTALVNTLK